MKEKEILRVEGPFGSFFLREDSDKPMVLLASGTGFAPIKAIIEHMIWKGSERKAVLYWGCRSKADLYLNDWAEEATREAAAPALHPGALRGQARGRLAPAAPASSTRR